MERSTRANNQHLLEYKGKKGKRNIRKQRYSLGE
jgi:ribosomal protein L35